MRRTEPRSRRSEITATRPRTSTLYCRRRLCSSRQSRELDGLDRSRSDAPRSILAGVATQASKAGLLAAMSIVLIFAAIQTRRPDLPARTRTTIRVSALVLVFVFGGVGAVLSRHRWAELPQEASLHGGRAEVWHVALDVWDEHPITGAGPGSFKILLPAVTAAREPQLYEHWIVSNYEPGHPATIWMFADDDPLQTLAEWGAVGALLFGTILAWPLARGFRSTGGDRFDQAVRAGGLLALAVLYVHSLIDFPLQVFAVQLTAGIWAALLMGGIATWGHESPRS